MYASLVLILKAVGILSGFLLLGTILRAKVPVFQNLYLPASVIGGFIALILGPRLLGWLPFSDEIMDTIGSMPSVLITPVFAAIPMCLYLKKNGNSILKTSNDAIVMTMILGGFFMFQCVLGIIAAVFSRVIGANTYDVMGLELAFGFNGGHGMAGRNSAIRTGRLHRMQPSPPLPSVWSAASCWAFCSSTSASRRAGPHRSSPLPSPRSKC